MRSVCGCLCRLGITERRGSGKLRHIHIGLLWIQEKRANEEIKFHKIDGHINPADLMTKNMAGSTMDGHTNTIGVRFMSGRADVGLSISRGIS